MDWMFVKVGRSYKSGVQIGKIATEHVIKLYWNVMACDVEITSMQEQISEVNERKTSSNEDAE